MAEPDDGSISIDVDDPATVQVAGDDNIDPALETQQAEPKPKARTRTPKSSPDPLPEDALAEAQAFAKSEKERREAAEATAASERQRADNAEVARQAALKQAEEHAERASNTELNLIESRIASEQNTLSALQEAYEKAAEAGEFKKMADLQIKMSRSASALDRFESAKADIEANPRTPTTEGAVTAPQPSSPVEQHLAGYSPAAQTWLRQHMDCLPPQFGGTPAKHYNMMAGHNAALAKGFAANSEPYFKEIEAHINPTAEVVPSTPHTSRAAETTPATSHRAPPAPSAPPSREAPQASGQPQRNARSVTLTKEQQEMARMSFPDKDPKEAYGIYARNLLELEAEGKIGRLTH